MKVLFFDTTQAFLTPGGKTVHALKLHQELSLLGVDVEFARWWDESQKDFDLIHFFSASNSSMIQVAKSKGKKILLTHIMDYETNKSSNEKRKAKIKIKLLRKLPSFFQSKFDWFHLPLFDHIVYMHGYDQRTALEYYTNIDAEKTSVIPHAYDPGDMNIGDAVSLNIVLPEKYLISCGTISERKQSLLLARLAKEAKVPVVFVGSYRDTDPYYQSFIKEVDNKYVFYLGYVNAQVKDYVESRAAGFVLLSSGESGCIAVYEAAAYHLPLLLSNLPWAWGYENPTEIYFCDYQYREKAIKQLADFFEVGKKLDAPPFTVNSWSVIAGRYKKCYERLLGINT